ncbi:porin family protein [Aliiglaciecola litoralis]|uniref:Porin family protein n=1 Tax=Aliiglaciecola litoralis TaxID=582857 RepID=A0ABP3WPH1_9ALTE
MKKLIPLLAVSALTATSYAQANDDLRIDNGFYLGGNYGHLRVDGDDEFDDDKDAYQFLGGYQFNSYFAIEGSYVDFGEYGSDVASVDTDGYTLGLKGILPISDRFSVHAKLGQLWYESTLNTFNFSDNNEDEGLFTGLGVAYALTPSLSVSFDYTLYDADLDTEEAFEDFEDANFSTDLKQASIGFSYIF